MPNYEELYHLMVNASEAAIAALEKGNVWDAKRILIEAEQEAEENQKAHIIFHFLVLIDKLINI